MGFVAQRRKPPGLGGDSLNAINVLAVVNEESAKQLALRQAQDRLKLSATRPPTELIIMRPCVSEGL